MHTLHTRIGMPIPSGRLNSIAAWKQARYLIKECDKKDMAISIAKDPKSKRGINIEFANKKLSFFYDISLSAVSSHFDNRVSLEERRKDEDELDILAGNITAKETEITEYLQLLNDNRMSAIISEADDAKSMDISGFFRKVSLRKLKDQTDTYKMLYQAATYEYQELHNLAGKMNMLLDYTRSCAFRNLYLGSELLNIVRDNSGGGGLQKADDCLKFGIINCDSIELKELSVSFDVGKVFSDFDKSWKVLNKKESYRRLASKNPKMDIAIQALLLIGSLIEEHENKRNQKIDNLLKMQRKLVKLFSRIVTIYNETQPLVIRSLELVLGMLEANKGFIKIYAPLRDKVYSQTSTISRQEIIDLGAAMNAYNKISNSKL
ncbi:MAG: hypothetical protein IJZ70_00225 [Bacteroidales bacterium]|nr:hypothetical protein [Bacteroidales bacterium]